MKTKELTREVALRQVQLQGETYFKLSNSDAMRPFFMSIVSDANHWMFIASNGGLTAGRKHADKALFPYYTDDKITESADTTGSKTVFRVQQDGRLQLWEPFSERYEGQHRISRNLYKHMYGHKVLFEEINHDLQLAFRYEWSSSDAYGFVRRAMLFNQADFEVAVSVLDGIQNIMPCGVESDFQMRTSNLVDAYKKNELEQETGLGIFALSAIISDKAEPSEALKANIAWSLGWDAPTYLLSSRQLKAFRQGRSLVQEVDVRAERGAYFVQAELELAPRAQKEWMVVADVNKDHAYLAALSRSLQQEPDMAQKVKEDIERGTRRLRSLVAAADGLQQTRDEARNARHFSNVLFNIMRGGIFDHNYQIERADFADYLACANKAAYEAVKPQLDGMPPTFSLLALQDWGQARTQDPVKRLATEYLPLKFSRRHGDPSRPWNRFSINTRSEVDGSKILDYEGNWRDIFQNWEALAHAYPAFIEGMIHKFLNATTFDGYNPYRVTKGGFDWETIEPDDPWSYIGYWGDHQIIYLLKLLEFQEQYQPGRLAASFGEDRFVYANVPYCIKAYKAILQNPKDTIEFDLAADQEIRRRRAAMGADGALLCKQDGTIYQVNFIEKMLAPLLAKLSNFIPEGGIWMNTQRPEWNDANNALVGHGVSMVTLYYLRRFLRFFSGLLSRAPQQEVTISAELLTFFEGVMATFVKHQQLLSTSISDEDRKRVLDGVGQAASTYRTAIYEQGFSGEKQPLNVQDLNHLLALAQEYVDHTIEANERPDHLYHAYNLMTVAGDDKVTVSHLSEMLEGQVAVLSSGYLSSEKVLKLLDGMKGSRLFREDQYSYLLYPNKELPRFLEKNHLPASAVEASDLLQALLRDGNLAILSQDVNGAYHFNGNFRNAGDLGAALEALEDTAYAPLVASERGQLLQLFEDVFDHKSFTGRSGTFFGYEGLGSIYWHMVSKLHLAVQACCLDAMKAGKDEELIRRLLMHYDEIGAGIGVHKPPSLYGAFPTDPYSHTPAGKGAQQPGMTGQVKEDILVRLYELGIVVEEGKLAFKPTLLKKDEFLEEAQAFSYVDVQQQSRSLPLPGGSLAFTYCQVPVVYQFAETNQLQVIYEDGTSTSEESLSLDQTTSKLIFERTGKVRQLLVNLKQSNLL